MITTPNDHVMEPSAIDPAQQETPPSSQRATSLQSSSNTQLAPRRTITHQPKAGLNPITDAAANLFSIAGRIKQLNNYRHLSKLHQDLMQEIQAFQNTAKTQGYGSEHILVSRYALCATVDDIIKHTSWGSEGKWEQYSLLTAFHPDTVNPDRFFVILDRIIKEPALYIDILELMYICLSLGFEGPYRATRDNPQEFEKIIQRLYQQIRAYRGDFHKNLSPYLLKPIKLARRHQKPLSMKWALLIASCFILVVMSGLGYSLGTMISQIDQDLKQIGKSSFYETHA